ncbi:hypothetical protein [Streptomyces goshikiensis]|uniref:hypothetical protein n=1 Tax=Streptomyces goshikiensis TaxID=1942 RepID=UPI0036B9720E
MTDQPPNSEKKVTNQTNHSSGTFVAGNVLGSIMDLFAPAQRRSRPTPADGHDVSEDDYEDISGSLFGATFLAVMSGTAIVLLHPRLTFPGQTQLLASQHGS